MGRWTRTLRAVRSSNSAWKVCLKMTAVLIAVAGPLLVTMPVMAQSPWPGQTGNPVGYAAIGPLNDSTTCPAYSYGTAGNPVFISNCAYSSCPTISGSHVVFMSVDWNCGAGGLSITGSDITLYGSRVQSNDVGNYAVRTSGANIYLIYTSIVPLASFYAAPPNAAWPSSSAGTNATGCSSDAYCINGNDGFETSIATYGGGPVWEDHIDTWGMGGGPTIVTTNSGNYYLTESWIHDNADPSPQGYHSDGFACYVNGGAGPNNVYAQGNTIASLGNTNGLACQSATSGYSNINFDENYYSGYGYTTAFCAPSSVKCTNSTYDNNTYGTDIYSIFGPVYGVSLDSSTFWGCNKLIVTTGTGWGANGNGWTPLFSESGQFILPSGGATPFSTTDYLSNTVCAQMNPAALNFKTQAPGTTSSGQTVTLSNTGSSTLTISSIALASGSEFAIAGKTCGSSLSAGSSCNITVTFTPTSLGPQTDTLRIADNMASPASPQLVPLIGLGYGGSVSTQQPAAPTGLVASVQ